MIHGITDWGEIHLEQWEMPAPGEGLDVFLGRFNAATGKVISLDTLNRDPAGQGYIYAMTADRNGNFFVGGLYHIGLYVAKDKLENYYGEDWFVAIFGSSVCNCKVPSPEFSYTTAPGNILKVTYKGSTPYTAISWDFGDGSPELPALSPVHTYAKSGTYTVCVNVANSCGSKIYSKTVTTTGTAIIEAAGLSAVSVFPNPASVETAIGNASGGTRLCIYNMTGSEVLQITLEGNKNEIVDLRNLVPAVYMIRFTDKDGNQRMLKVVKR